MLCHTHMVLGAKGTRVPLINSLTIHSMKQPLGCYSPCWRKPTCTYLITCPMTTPEPTLCPIVEDNKAEKP